MDISLLKEKKPMPWERIKTQNASKPNIVILNH